MFKPIVRTLLILPLVLTLCSAIGAQTGNVDAQSAVPLFLQSHPEVVDQLKALLAQQLQDEGSAIDQQAISDATLSARLESDGKFRAAALRLLVDRGSISEEQAKALSARAVPSKEVSSQGAHQLEERSTAQSDRATTPTSGMVIKSPVIDQRFDDSSINPRTIARPNPYPNLPSTKALYSQFPDEPMGLVRFGSEIFRPDVIGLSQFPMDLPAGPDYVLGSGDNLILDIWGGVSQKLTRTVDREGRWTSPTT